MPRSKPEPQDWSQRVFWMFEDVKGIVCGGTIGEVAWTIMVIQVRQEGRFSTSNQP